MKAIALLSGGIDSPVAIHLVRKRVNIVAVHFHQIPLTGQEEIEKVKKLVTKLRIKKIYLIPYAEVLKEIASKCNHREYYTLSKIAMFQAAESIAKKEGAELLLTGENLAQVSSQTLSNMKSITSQLKLTVIRPLLTYDKQEIIDTAKKIGTYEVSKGPEICSLLGPSNPTTKSKIEKVELELNRIDLKKLNENAINKAEILNTQL